jgi:hypothetical protein
MTNIDDRTTSVQTTTMATTVQKYHDRRSQTAAFARRWAGLAQTRRTGPVFKSASRALQRRPTCFKSASKAADMPAGAGSAVLFGRKMQAPEDSRRRTPPLRVTHASQRAASATRRVGTTHSVYSEATRCALAISLLSVRISTPGRHPKTFGFDVAEGRISETRPVYTGSRIRSQI